VWVKETSANELLMRHRNSSSDDIETGGPPRFREKGMAVTDLLAMRVSGVQAARISSGLRYET
jgi:hypothetical protein